MTTEPEQRQEDDYVLLRRVEQCSLLLTALLALGGVYVFGSQFALSALLGGAVSLGSFIALKRTMMQLVSRIDTQNPAAGFAFKFYLRLLALAVLLAAVGMSVQLHLPGLLAGLSTVMVSVFSVVLIRGLMDFSGKGKHAKGA
ncbi:MAG: ATP synthase subunit I [Candidatus Electronema sp. V4]|uniref:ATP synthase subunit I n=1 Tax=Candidatus Electronema sp. V4 TaxID=3454756 RepID=UPI0040557BA6